MQFGGGNKCGTCGKTVYPNEQIAFDGKFYHPTGCFVCSICKEKIQSTSKAGSMNGLVSHRLCFEKQMRETGGKYGGVKVAAGAKATADAEKRGADQAISKQTTNAKDATRPQTAVNATTSLPATAATAAQNVKKDGTGAQTAPKSTAMSESKEFDVKVSDESSIHALDFTKLIEEKQRAHFAGTREWLFDAVRLWLNSTTKRLFWVVGDGGTGKSVVSAKLLQMEGIQEHIVAWHFCRHDNAAGSEAKVILMSWAAMLSEKLAGFHLPKLSKSLAAASVEETFEQLISGPLSRMAAPASPCVIVLDALDELPKEALFPVLGLIANVFESLPKFVRLFVTSRNQKEIVKRLEKFDQEKLLVDEVRNRADLRAYLAHVARQYVNLEITTASLETRLENEFNLQQGALKGKLAELESLIAQSKYIYQTAAAEFKSLPEYRDTCKIRDIIPDPPAAQTCGNFEELYEDANLAHAKCVSSFTKGKVDGWVDVIIDPGLKTEASARRKVQDDYKGNAALLKDLVRFTAECTSCSRMNVLLERIRSQSKDFQFVCLRNKHANPTALGYRDFNLTLLVRLGEDRGHLCELQVNLRSMLDAKAKAHVLYEKVRVHIPHICAAANIINRNRFESCLTKMLDDSVLDAAVAELELKAGGLFLYATLVADQLEQDNKQDTKIDFSNLFGLPSGLNEIYRENFDRLVGGDHANWMSFVPVIALVVASREPIPLRLVQAVLGAGVEDVQTALSVLFPVREGCFQVMHKSVVDWLRDGERAQTYTITASNLQTAHVTLGRYLAQFYSNSHLGLDSSLHIFAMHHVMYHLCEGGLLDEAYSVVTNLHWVMERAKSGPAGLITDAELIATIASPHQTTCKLLHNALRSSVHEWSENYGRLPAQLVGRLLSYETDADVGEFLKRVRGWVGPAEGWWCPIQQTLPPAGGPALSVVRLPKRLSVARWSSDGRFVAWSSNSNCNITTVTDVATGEHTVLEGHTAAVLSVAFSNDGKKVCSGSSDKTIRVWNIESGKCIKMIETQHAEGISCVIFSQDDSYLCSGSHDKKITVWDLESGQCIQTLEGHEAQVNSVALSRDKQRVYSSGSYDKTARVWNVQSGECVHILQGHRASVFSVSVSSDGKKVCSTSSDETIRVWDTESGACIQTLQGHAGTVFCAVFNSDDKQICSGSLDRTVRVWESDSGKCLQTLEGHTAGVTTILFASDEKRVCSTGDDQTVRTWDRANTQCMQKVEGHIDDVFSVAFSGDSKYVCSGGQDPTLRIWDIETNQCVKTLEGKTAYILSIVFSSDGKKIYSGTVNNTICVWDVDSSQCIQILKGHTSTVFAVAGSSDRKKICSGSLDKTVRVWDVESYQCTHTFTGHTFKVEAVAFSEDSKNVCSGSHDKTVRVWDLESGQCIHIFEGGHNSAIKSVAFSSDGKKLCSSSYIKSDITVRVWDLESGFSFCTQLLDQWFQPVKSPVKFESAMRVVMHPSNPSRAVGFESAAVHCLSRLGVAASFIKPVEFSLKDEVQCCEKCSDQFVSPDAKHHCMSCGRVFCNVCCPESSEGRTCVGCLHHQWCLLNLIHLPQGIEEEEQAAQEEQQKKRAAEQPASTAE